jgi:hypothetical protein
MLASLKSLFASAPNPPIQIQPTKGSGSVTTTPPNAVEAVPAALKQPPLSFSQFSSFVRSELIAPYTLQNIVIDLSAYQTFPSRPRNERCRMTYTIDPGDMGSSYIKSLFWSGNFRTHSIAALNPAADKMGLAYLGWDNTVITGEIARTNSKYGYTDSKNKVVSLDIDSKGLLNNQLTTNLTILSDSYTHKADFSAAYKLTPSLSVGVQALGAMNRDVSPKPAEQELKPIHSRRGSIIDSINSLITPYYTGIQAVNFGFHYIQPEFNFAVVSSNNASVYTAYYAMRLSKDHKFFVLAEADSTKNWQKRVMMGNNCKINDSTLMKLRMDAASGEIGGVLEKAYNKNLLVSLMGKTSLKNLYSINQWGIQLEFNY